MKIIRRYVRFPEWDAEHVDFDAYEKFVAEEIKYQIKKHNLIESRELTHHELRRMYPYLPLRYLAEIRIFELKGYLHE